MYQNHELHLQTKSFYLPRKDQGWKIFHLDQRVEVESFAGFICFANAPLVTVKMINVNETKSKI